MEQDVRNNLPVAFLGAMFLSRILKNLEPPTGDVHTSAVGGEGLGAHQANAGAAAGDEAGPAIDVEELGSLEGMCIDHFDGLVWFCCSVGNAEEGS